MNFTQNDLKEIERAIASGRRKVKFNDSEIEYRSIDEMLKIRDLIKKSLESSTKSDSASVFGSSIQLRYESGK